MIDFLHYRKKQLEIPYNFQTCIDRVLKNENTDCKGEMVRPLR